MQYDVKQPESRQIYYIIITQPLITYVSITVGQTTLRNCLGQYKQQYKNN
ncbi:unnamed protein product [Paramecium octaurelia]|uniref:Uncharacterized protein n=1 Tax=Paramecium octaurelia TaxID=43137 RepID=A0A8S1YQR4_PAROT|nr:unnamed protein product [Paramecium octaurelia]